MALKKFASVSSVGLNLRAGSSKDSELLDSLSKGDRVEIIEARAGWLFVRVERTGQRGWVYAEHVKLETPKPDVPVVPTFDVEPKLEIYHWVGIALAVIVGGISLTTCIGP